MTRADKLRSRLTQKDEQGNWCLKGLNWVDLRAGKTLTKEMRDSLYGALWKLMEYEDTGYTPEQIQEFDTLYLEKCQEVNELRERTRWIPVEERLPTEEESLKSDGRFILDDGNKRYQGLFDIYDGKFKFPKKINENNFGLFEDECVVAWKPFPEPYKPEKPRESPYNATGWQQRMLNAFFRRQEIRLIDADEFREQVIGAALKVGTCSAAEKADALVNLIDAQPTAYDVDKVVEQLERMKN